MSGLHAIFGPILILLASHLLSQSLSFLLTFDYLGVLGAILVKSSLFGVALLLLRHVSVLGLI